VTLRGASQVSRHRTVLGVPQERQLAAEEGDGSTPSDLLAAGCHCQGPLGILPGLRAHKPQIHRSLLIPPHELTASTSPTSTPPRPLLLCPLLLPLPPCAAPQPLPSSFSSSSFSSHYRCCRPQWSPLLPRPLRNARGVPGPHGRRAPGTPAGRQSVEAQTRREASGRRATEENP